MEVFALVRMTFPSVIVSTKRGILRPDYSVKVQIIHELVIKTRHRFVSPWVHLMIFTNRFKDILVGWCYEDVNNIEGECHVKKEVKLYLIGRCFRRQIVWKFWIMVKPTSWYGEEYLWKDIIARDRTTPLKYVSGLWRYYVDTCALTWCLGAFLVCYGL